MRTNIIINDDLMDEAMHLSGLKTKKETVESALKLLVRINRQKAIRAAKGKLQWDGDLEKMRLDK